MGSSRGRSVDSSVNDRSRFQKWSSLFGGTEVSCVLGSSYSERKEILVLDEATLSVEGKTDALIRRRSRGSS